MGTHFHSRWATGTKASAVAAVALAVEFCLVSALAQEPEAAAEEPEPTTTVEAAEPDITNESEAATTTQTTPDDNQADPTTGENEPQPTSRFETRIDFLNLVEERQFDEAVLVGQKLAEIVAVEAGEDSDEYGEVLVELGEVQRRAEQHEAAEATFLKSIDIFTHNGGNFSPTLIGPLTGLGSNYNDMEAYRPALGAFNEARSISRRSYGLLNEDQIPILDRMTTSFLGLNDYEQADAQQLDALYLQQRRQGGNTMEVLPAIYKYARWLRSMGRYDEERLYYLRAMDIIKRRVGKINPAIAKPLRETANSFRAQRFPEGLGASSLKRSIELLKNADPPVPESLAESYRDLGDWYTAFSKIGRGSEEYRRAWEALENAGNGDKLRREWFSDPVFVYYEPPSQRGLRPAGSEPGLVDGFVVVQFDLSPTGRTENVTVIDSDPEGKKDDTIARSMRKSRLRPRVVDGEPIRAEGLVRRYTFTYKPD